MKTWRTLFPLDKQNSSRNDRDHKWAIIPIHRSDPKSRKQRTFAVQPIQPTRHIQGPDHKKIVKHASLQNQWSRAAETKSPRRSPGDTTLVLEEARRRSPRRKRGGKGQREGARSYLAFGFWTSAKRVFPRLKRRKRGLCILKTGRADEASGNALRKKMIFNRKKRAEREEDGVWNFECPRVRCHVFRDNDRYSVWFFFS